MANSAQNRIHLGGRGASFGSSLDSNPNRPSFSSFPTRSAQASLRRNGFPASRPSDNHWRDVRSRPLSDHCSEGGDSQSKRTSTSSIHDVYMSGTDLALPEIQHRGRPRVQLEYSTQSTPNGRSSMAKEKSQTSIITPLPTVSAPLSGWRPLDERSHSPSSEGRNPKRIRYDSNRVFPHATPAEPWFQEGSNVSTAPLQSGGPRYRRPVDRTGVTGTSKVNLRPRDQGRSAAPTGNMPLPMRPPPEVHSPMQLKTTVASQSTTPSLRGTDGQHAATNETSA